MADLTDTDWLQPLTERLGQSYFDAVQQFLKTVYASGAVYPARENVFAAYRATPLSQVKVVILGQDPYPNPDQAQGLSFSV
ncbi:MAG: uracil-DNA glycosylase, partial [Weissella cibaria]